ncbi:MAG TPA: flagellar motor protein MotB [Anaeromyxobacter sp.]|nr:flagellar motor protein MotB [Anaeromyxobacter sp.]
MARKPRPEEHENHERWLVSYADFMTLLFAFFVVMYAVSRVDNKRLIQAAESIRWAMHFSGTGGTGALPIFDGPPTEGGGPALRTGKAKVEQEKEAIEMLRKKLEKRVRPFVIDRLDRPIISVVVEGRKLTVRLAATEFFDPGQAVLRPQVLPVLDAIADELVPLQRLLRAEGHTDETPLGNERWRNNWELSAARAATVVTYLEQAHAARPELLAAVGLGSSHPLVRGDTPEARDRNRRVELVLELDPKDEILGTGLE